MMQDQRGMQSETVCNKYGRYSRSDHVTRMSMQEQGFTQADAQSYPAVMALAGGRAHAPFGVKAGWVASPYCIEAGYPGAEATDIESATCEEQLRR